MESRWQDKEASEFVVTLGNQWGEDLAVRTYSSRMIGAEKELVLHGGGNTSVKGSFTNVLGEEIPVLFIKSSGSDLVTIEPKGHPALDLDYLRELRKLSDLSDEIMVNELLTHRFDARAATPSIETLLHAFLPHKFVDHTHADAILALTNRREGDKAVRSALGSDVIVLEYVKPGFALAKAVAEAFEASPASKGMVLMKHGLLTWGSTARESYERTIELVTRAEQFLARKGVSPIPTGTTSDPVEAKKRYMKIAPILRGLMAIPTGDADRPYQRFIFRPHISAEVLDLLDSDRGREIALTSPLTTDHLIRTKTLPLWTSAPQYDDEKKLRDQLSAALTDYAGRYDDYFERHSHRMKTPFDRFDSMPRTILMPGVGAICAGRDVVEAGIVRDIVVQTLAVKVKIAATGSYEGLGEAHLFDMEYSPLQRAKLRTGDEAPLQRSVALITGAAGAIGSGICRALLEQGCHVAATDLAGDSLSSLVSELATIFGERVIGIPLDVTDANSVARGFDRVIGEWGGVDLVVVNAGIAHVSSLADMDPDVFRRLEQVNVEGTLHILSAVSRHFKGQGTGGDIILISTKNVFAPGAKFGAYSATKAAAHQLVRIASLELAEIGVRVNMVSPDAVFGEGGRKSGLWAEVGPDRMRARGLDEKGLEEYYRQRNLLKAKVTAQHVGRAVLFFATRQTPTTGATIPVDGGLPEATPR